MTDDGRPILVSTACCVIAEYDTVLTHHESRGIRRNPSIVIRHPSHFVGPLLAGQLGEISSLVFERAFQGLIDELFLPCGRDYRGAVCYEEQARGRRGESSESAAETD